MSRFNSSIIGRIQALDLALLEVYLELNNWTETRSFGLGKVWIKRIQNEEYEILTPKKRMLDDFVERISDALHTLSVVEKVNPEEILAKISSVSTDVVRVRVVGPSTTDGQIPLANGVELIKQTYDMILSAACGEITKKAVYPGRKYEQAMKYIAGVRLGQTEVGSYVVTAHSPLPQSDQRSIVNDAEDLFGRRVLKQFSKALSAVHTASAQALSQGNLESFNTIVESGVSANLCEAIAGIRSHDPSANVVIDLDWAPSFDPPTELPKHFEFSVAQIPILQQAAEKMRESDVVEDFELKGWIMRLEREAPSGTGRVIVVSSNEDYENKHIRIELSGEDYVRAINAHKAYHVIRCKGSLKREGRLWFLQDAREFVTEAVIPNEGQ